MKKVPIKNFDLHDAAGNLVTKTNYGQMYVIMLAAPDPNDGFGSLTKQRDLLNIIDKIKEAMDHDDERGWRVREDHVILSNEEYEMLREKFKQYEPRWPCLSRDVGVFDHDLKESPDHKEECSEGQP